MLKYSRKFIRRGITRRTAEEPDRIAPHVELFYWRSAKGVNFGDYLSSVVVTKIAADAGFFLDEERAEPVRILAIGSILHFARNGDVIWGSGMNGKVSESSHKFDNLDVRSVRGPMTRHFLQARGIVVPELYGDPAILVPSLLPDRFPRSEQPGRSVVFVPNLHDLPIMKDWDNVVSPLAPWYDVVRQISQARHVISTSLHGLVLADAFGIPCTYLRLSETESLFKYEDYVLGVGRGGLTVTTSREEALRLKPMDLPKPDLVKLRQSFPFDLWTK